MESKNLIDMIEITSRECLENNKDYIEKRISKIINGAINGNRDMAHNIPALIGCAAGASTITAVELSTTILVQALAQLGLIEHDGHPGIRVMKDDEV